MLLFNTLQFFRIVVLLSSLLLTLSCSESGSSTVTGADPGVLEAPIAFVKRPVPLDEDGDEIQSDLREPLFFAEGGDIYIRSNSTVTATEKNITAEVTAGQGDVKDLKPSFDGKKLLFTLRQFDPNPNDDDTPTWNIYEYDLETDQLRCVIDDDPATAICDGFEAEEGDDISPAYLPDGRIVFSSNRQTQSVELVTNENKPRFKALVEREDTWAMLLHVMDQNGDNLHQITFNMSHDLDPLVLTHNFSGQVMYMRWDNAVTNKGMHLYKVNPDGTGQQVLYGVHSHNSGTNMAGTNDETIQFSQAEEMEDGRLIVITRPFSGTYGGGDLAIIDIENYINNDQPVFSLTGQQGVAQTTATINNVSSANELSPGGRYSAVWPLWDGSGRILISQSSCEILADGVRRPCIEPYLSADAVEEVSPVYSIWLYDLNSQVQKVIVPAEVGMVFTDIVALQSRSTTPSLIQDDTSPGFNLNWKEEGLGAIHIRSVYDFGDGNVNVFNNNEVCFDNECKTVNGVGTVNELGDPLMATADDRPARFVRFVKAVSLPDEDDPDLNNPPDLNNQAFGPSRNLGMSEIIGYAPVEPDGSVKVKIPANIALSVSVLDKMGRRISDRHQNWFQVRPGETLECTGCHSHDNQNTVTPNQHHRSDAEAPSINAGVPGSLEFPNTQIPGTVLPYSGSFGKSMAEVRFERGSESIPKPSEFNSDEPHVLPDVIFSDYWTDPNKATAADSFSYKYENLDVALRSPASSPACTSWDFRCRIVINYQEHIHQLWSLSRGVDGADTCTSCHNSVDDMGQAMVPAGQLSLVAALDIDENSQRIKSYLELFFADNGQILNGDILEDDTIMVPVDADNDGIQDEDINGVPIFDTIPNPASRVSPSMSRNGARASFFVNKMTDPVATRNGSLGPADTGYLDHSMFMSADELKMVIEWLDIGAQYFNNPFDPAAPMN